MGSSAPAPKYSGVAGFIQQDLGRLADPLGIDPMGNKGHDTIAGVFAGNGGQSAADMYKKSPQKKIAKPVPQSMEAKARLNAFQSAKNDIIRRRASQTLFGGSASLDEPSSASSTLIGV